MKTTIDISSSLILEAMKLSKSRTKTEAVKLALEAFIHQRRLEWIISEAGSLEFSDHWEKERHAR